MKSRSLLFYLLIVVFYSGSVVVAAPATLVQSVSDGGETITLRMTKESSRGPNFEVWVQNGTGAYDVHTPAEVSTYIGTVDEYPGAIAAGILKSDGDLWARVYFDRGYTWFTLGSSQIGELGTSTPNFVKPTLPTVTEGHAGTTTYRWDLSIDVDNDYYTGNYVYYTGNYANDVAKCLENIEFSLMQLRAIYLRDALLNPVLGRIIIRASIAHDPYDGITSAGGFLSAVAAEWGSNHADADRDATALATPNIGGGIAWGGVIGNAYTVNQTWGGGDFDLVTRHETGHNWGVADFHANSPEGYTIDCGNDFGRFAGPSVQSIFNHRDLKMGCLIDQGVYSIIEVPPYAALDLAGITNENTTVTIDVLGNDHDTNGDTFVIDSFDSTSDLGGTITLSAGTGPGGRDELTYTSSIQPGLTDNFFYTIVDSAGSIATGVVIVYHDVPKSLIGYWRLDETTGTTAQDSSGNERTGTVNGTTFDSGSTVDSEFGNALALDGIDDNVSVPATNLNSNTVTMTAWIKRDGSQGYFKGILFSRSNFTSAGLNFLSTTNNLAHCWGVDGAIWNWNSGLTVPNNTWTFVALAVDPTGATLYMDSGAGLVSSRNNVAHPIQQFEDVTRIGGDSYNGYMKGKIDDARIYNYTLTQEQIEAVRDGGKAANPDPTDKITEAPINPTLSWAPNATATSHDVYFGTSQAAVEDANTLSPEYMGRQAETTYEPNELSTNSTYS